MIMQASLKEEEERVERVKQEQKKEQEIVHKIEEESIQELKQDELKRQASKEPEIPKKEPVQEVLHEALPQKVS